MSLHIGEKIKARAKELRIGPTELASLVNTSKQNIYGIYKRKTLDSDLLKKLSLALKHDFFSYYYDKQLLGIFNEDQAPYAKKNRSEKQEVEALKQELQALKEKYELLQKLYILTEEKVKKNK